MVAYILEQILNGLILGAMYALVAIGFSMIYGIVNLINFAHGDIVMIGAFVTLGLILGTGLPFPIIALAVLAAGCLMGIVIERTAFRPMRGAPPGDRLQSPLWPSPSCCRIWVFWSSRPNPGTSPCPNT